MEKSLSLQRKMKVCTILSHNTVVACGHALRVFITCCMCGHLSSWTHRPCPVVKLPLSCIVISLVQPWHAFYSLYWQYNSTWYPLHIIPHCTSLLFITVFKQLRLKFSRASKKPKYPHKPGPLKFPSLICIKYQHKESVFLYVNMYVPAYVFVYFRSASWHVSQ